MLCEFTQNDFINAKKDLHKKKMQKHQLALQYQEVDQVTVTLKNKHGQLENQIHTMKMAASPPKKPDPNADLGQEEKDPNINMWGKPISPHKKTRSHNAMFQPDTSLGIYK